jgi:hypothetical protein
MKRLVRMRRRASVQSNGSGGIVRPLAYAGGRVILASPKCDDPIYAWEGFTWGFCRRAAGFNAISQR